MCWKTNSKLLSIFILTLVAFAPSWNNDFIWDDESYVVDNVHLRTLDGLRAIWFDPQATPQYYPLTYTVFWIEYQLWGLNPMGYHVVNTVLHALNALLVFSILKRLNISGAWVTGLVFAVHPICVDSVVWITELKNVLAGFWMLLSLLAYCYFAGWGAGEHDQDEGSKLLSVAQCERRALRKRFWWCVSFFSFSAGLFCKTAILPLPMVLLILTVWQEGKWRWSRMFSIFPFFLLGFCLGLVTVWVELNHAGAQGASWSNSSLERVFVAGRAVWFYLGKIVWPTDLNFIYPRWEIDGGDYKNWVYPIALLISLGCLWGARRRIGAGYFAASLMFLSLLAPALGFINIYFMRFSYVSDHFQYFGSSVAIAAVVSAITALFARLKVSMRKRVEIIFWSGVLLAFIAGTWKHSSMYDGLETLWTETLERNPDAWLAHHNLASVYEGGGDWERAEHHFRESLKLNPNYAEAFYNLAQLCSVQGRYREAVVLYGKALEIYPEYGMFWNQLGHAYYQLGENERAIESYQQAMIKNPEKALPYFGMGQVYLDMKEFERAAIYFIETLQRDPVHPEALYNLAIYYTESGQFHLAMHQVEMLLHAAPDFEPAIDLQNAISGLQKN